MSIRDEWERHSELHDMLLRRCARCNGTRIEPQSAPAAPCLACSARRTTFRAPAVQTKGREPSTATVREGDTILLKGQTGRLPDGLYRVVATSDGTKR